MGRQTINADGLKMFNRRDSWLQPRISVKGDCGIIHPTFEDWQHCKACERSLARALLSP